MDKPPELKIYSTEEIEIFLSGERREVDRLLLHGLNNLAIVMIPHVNREDALYESMGSHEKIRQRAAWIDAQIDAQLKRNGMMGRIAEASLIAVFLLFIGYIGVALWDHTVALIQATKQANGK